MSGIASLPALGLGLSTEYGASLTRGAVAPAGLRREHPAFGGFLEVGVETSKGLDAVARDWANRGWPTTYHFLDVNLDEPEDLDEGWLNEVRAGIARLRPAWLCGDLGMWHFGRRERGQMLLLPPVLTASGATASADGIRALSEATGRVVLPENPPGTAYVGDLHLLDYFARVTDEADTGMLLDIAHLVIYQRLHGLPPTAGLDGFPVERIVELHVAGGAERTRDGWAYVEDDHSPRPLADTWAVLEALLPRATGLRAVVFEAERNSLAEVVPGFRRIRDLVARLAPWALPT